MKLVKTWMAALLAPLVFLHFSCTEAEEPDPAFVPLLRDAYCMGGVTRRRDRLDPRRTAAPCGVLDTEAKRCLQAISPRFTWKSVHSQRSSAKLPP